MNSGNILIKDNPDPSMLNGNIVNMKEQRLTGEESTNKPDTSAEHPWMSFEDYKLEKEFRG